jgi:hypothetical protein
VHVGLRVRALLDLRNVEAGRMGGGHGAPPLS